MRATLTVLVVTAALATGCSPSAPPAVPQPAQPSPLSAPEAPLVPSSKATFDAFAESYADIRRHDLASDWTEEECLRLGHKLAAVPAHERPLVEALYDSGIALSRCGKDAEAAAQFRAALAVDPRFAPARVQVAALKAESDGNLGAAMGALEAIVMDAQFQSTEGLINLARLQRRRGASLAIGSTCTSSKGGTQVTLDDLECARMNAQRALAIDDSSAPAMNELARVYLTRGQLDLTLLICDQGIKRYPSFAPLHVTSGAALAAKGTYNAAIAEFDRARKLDTRSFDAQMTLADASVAIHDFAKAQEGYNKALALRPNDYGAHLGLALALRGLIMDANLDAQLALVRAELEACRQIDAARPDAYYNAGILAQEFSVSTARGVEQTLAALREAKSLFMTFLDRAAGKPAYAGAVKRARQRMQDIDDVVAFVRP
jgi:tetratricopeptide (TPR) repeat protein